MGQVVPGRRGYHINNAYGHDGLKLSDIQGSYKEINEVRMRYQPDHCSEKSFQRDRAFGDEFAKRPCNSSDLEMSELQF